MPESRTMIADAWRALPLSGLPPPGVLMSALSKRRGTRLRLAPSVLAVVVAIATVAAGPQTAQPAEIRPLEPGQPIERDLAGGGFHAYRVTVAGGQFCHILVDQRGI